MSQDVVVNQKPLLADFKAAPRTTPVYLLTLDDGAVKGTTVKSYFVAIKFDDPAGSHYTKCVGLPIENPDDVIRTFDQMLKDAPIENFVEVLFPWQKVINVRSLTYRHKSQQQSK